LAVTIFWMVCGWRAMRAHEDIADSIARIALKSGSDQIINPR
jgi:hypothetical protein